MASDHENVDATDSAGFACALCNKSFVRRDLRNRHRRRCEKSIGKQRVSKKRSCDACGKSKLKCDLAMPSCSRCITRQIPCQYPPETIAAAQNAGQEGAPLPFVPDLNLISDELASLHGHQAFAPTHTPTGSLPNYYPPLHMHGLASQSPMFHGSSMDDAVLDAMSLDTDVFSRNSSDFWDPTGAGLIPGDASSHAESFLGSCGLTSGYPMATSSAVEDAMFGAPQFLDSVQLSSPSELISPQHLPFHNPLSAARSITNDTSSYPNSTFSLETGSTASPESSLADPGLFMKHSRNRPSLHLTTPTAHVSPKSMLVTSSPSPPPNVSPTDLYRDSGARSLPTPAHSRPGSISSLDSLSLALQQSYRTLFSIEEAATILCEYPTEMLDKNYRSPFLHHKAHHGSEQGLPEPIAVALCCVSANTHSVESSVRFVCKMIDQQCERLISEFPKKHMDLEDSWSFLHALCIYQIESMLAMRKQRPRDCIMSAELHHAFLLKMARGASRDNVLLLRSVDNENIDWRVWTLVETLRRNLHLINMINDLSFATKALNGHYYEPLEDEYVADLPLPAPESVWRATSAQEWSSARDAHKWSGEGIMTLGQAIRKLQSGEDIGDLEPLQKLVVSCAWRRVGKA